MIDINRAKLDPASVFHHPADVLNESGLTRLEKIDILKRWAYDEREMAVAEEENMTGVNGDTNNTLDEILKCLLVLGKDSDDPSSPPTKQG